jgi:alginate O-acetyltransferase complex protein AlgI
LVFSSYVFLHTFLPLALALYYLSLPVTRRYWGGATACVLTLLSYVFYGWNRPDYCLLMLGSSLLDYSCGKGIAHDQAAGRKGTRFLLASLVGNLGLLGYFKYANLAVATWNGLATRAGADGAVVKDWAEIALPVGISFYTFQTMSYTIDLWRRAVVPARSFWDFMAYVSMFPQLVAGPIVRYSDVAEQLVERRHTLDGFFRGVLYFQLGFAKKVLIADNLAALADQAFGGGRFAAPEHIGVVDAWVGALAFTFQIYFDFSGYSDMAIGLGHMLGFKFPENFDAPYRATSVTDFWRRWHMSLSTWLRDYLYVSLGGNRKGAGRTYVNLAATMLLGGLWHGAQWTFVLWGAYQGFWLIFERVFAKRSLYAAAPRLVQVAVTFLITVVGWVFFKAPTVDAAFAHVAAMFGAHGAGIPAADFVPRYHGLVFAVAALVTWGFPTTAKIVEGAKTGYVLLAQGLFLWALVHLYWEDHVPFLYFQF